MKSLKTTSTRSLARAGPGAGEIDPCDAQQVMPLDFVHRVSLPRCDIERQLDFVDVDDVVPSISRCICASVRSQPPDDLRSTGDELFLGQASGLLLLALVGTHHGLKHLVRAPGHTELLCSLYEL